MNFDCTAFPKQPTTIKNSDNSGDELVIYIMAKEWGQSKKDSKYGQMATGGPYITMNGMRVTESRKFRVPVPTTAESIRRQKPPEHNTRNNSGVKHKP